MLWKSMCLFLKTLQIELPFDPAALLGRYPKHIWSTHDRDTCPFLFVTEPPTVAKEGAIQDVHHRGMDEENVANLCCGILFSCERESNGVICRKIDGTGNVYVKEKNADSERQTLHVSLPCKA